MSNLKNIPIIPQQPPTDAELEILSVLYAHGPQTVRFINDQINLHREVGYTTTLKIMQLMLEKGMLHRNIIDKAHIYQPALSEQQTQDLVIQEVKDLIFRGSTTHLVMNVLGNETVTAEELEKIKCYIDEIQKQQIKNP